MENKITRVIYGKYYTTEFELALPLANVILLKSYYNDTKKEILNMSIESSTFGIKEITFKNLTNNKFRVVRFPDNVDAFSYNLINLAIMHIIENFSYPLHQYIIFEFFDNLKMIDQAKRFHRLWDNRMFFQKLLIMQKKMKIEKINNKISNLYTKLITETQSLHKYQNEFEYLIGPKKSVIDSYIYDIPPNADPALYRHGPSFQNFSNTLKNK
jgi:hypothetical protein